MGRVKKSGYTWHRGLPFATADPPNEIRYISVDPGTTNYGLRIETHRPDGVFPLVFDLMDIRSPEVYSRLTQRLDEHLDIIRTCHLLIIESQPKVNQITVRVMQHTISYVLLKTADLAHPPGIVEINKNHVNTFFGIKRGEDSKGIMTQEVIRELGDRGDEWSLVAMTSAKRMHDLADTVGFIIVFCHDHGLRPSSGIVFKAGSE